MSGKPLDQLLAQTDPEGCSVIKLPSKIWVFGGHFNNSGPHLSLRDSFWRQTLTCQSPTWLTALDRPEDHIGWLEHSGYSDLLEFERDACYLAKAIVIFAESPGAHAELGATALDATILPRLVAVIQHQYTQGESENSFLALGPLRRIREKGCLCVVDDDPVTLSAHDFNDVIEAINGWLPTDNKREKLQTFNPCHQLLLIADLIDLMLLSSEPDIQLALGHFGFKVTIEQLRKHLSLLKFFKFINRYQAGTTPYWLKHGSDEGPWVDYTALSGQPKFDRTRFKLKAKELIDSNARLRSIYERGRN